MSNQDIKIRAAEKLPAVLKGLPIVHKPYCGEISQALDSWHTYLQDAGHSIYAILQCHEKQAFDDDPSKFLIPVPVKSVFRGYRVRDGYIIACSSAIVFDEVLGMITPEADSEY